MKISPSVLACDFCKLGQEVIDMQNAGADMIHLDVMDGHFVPNISFGPPIIAMLKKKTSIFFDVHLMLTNPLFYIQSFVEAGADLITFHVECDSDINATIDKIKSYGVQVGIALKPNTNIDVVLPFIEKVDLILVMTVEPGFGGQKFMQSQMQKLSDIKDYCSKNKLDKMIQVDGGIDNSTAPIAINAGANVLVAGSALFSQTDYVKAIKDLKA